MTTDSSEGDGPEESGREDDGEDVAPEESDSDETAEAEESGHEDADSAQSPRERTESGLRRRRIEFMQSGSAAAETVLSGGEVGRSGGPAEVVGEFIARTGRVIHRTALAVRESQSQFVAPPWITSFAWGSSAVVRFSVGADEHTGSNGDDSSPTIESVRTLARLFELLTIASREVEALDAFTEEVRELGERTGLAFSELLNLLATEQLDLEWAARHEQEVQVAGRYAATGHEVLERKVEVGRREFDVDGWLYQADAKNATFKLDPEVPGARTISGHYAPDLADRIAWNQRVTAQVRVTMTRKERAQRRVSRRFELLEIRAVLDAEGDPEAN